MKSQEVRREKNRKRFEIEGERKRGGKKKRKKNQQDYREKKKNSIATSQ